MTVHELGELAIVTKLLVDKAEVDGRADRVSPKELTPVAIIKPLVPAVGMLYKNYDEIRDFWNVK